MAMNAHAPYVTWILIAITVLVSWLALSRRAWMDRLLLWPPAISRRRQVDRLLTHGFVHADLPHLLFNMITLFFFGGIVERIFVDRIGTLGFLLFYVLAIVVAILPTYWQHRHDVNYRSLGASGAVSAVLFSYVLFAPWSMILVFFIPVPAIVYAVLYVAYSFWMDKKGTDNINHSAHLTGAAFGVVATLLIEPRAGTYFLQQIVNPRFG
jgi:membrane associated rhomboid family serine protease